MKIKKRFTETPGNRRIHSRLKKNWAPATRATVLGSSSNFDHRFRTAFQYRRSFGFLAKSAQTKRQVRKQTKKSQLYIYIQGSPSGRGSRGHETGGVSASV